MSEEQTLTVQEMRRIVRLLERIHRLAEESSRRGMMRDGQAYLIQQYHAIVASLAQRGHRLPDYFPELGEDATLGMVGFASAQVAEYLLESVEAEEAARGEGEATDTGQSFFEKFFNSGEFQHIGEAMREAMPDWVRASRAAREGAPRRGSEPRQSSTESGASPAASDAPGDVRVDRDIDVDVDVDVDSDPDRHLAALNTRVRELATQMRQSGVPPEEMQRLAAELAQLGEQQARLAQEIAARSR